MHANGSSTTPDPRLVRGLWQVLVLSALGLAILAPLRAEPPSAAAAGWLLGLPALALFTAYRNALRAAWPGVRAWNAKSPAPRRADRVRHASVPARRLEHRNAPIRLGLVLGIWRIGSDSPLPPQVALVTVELDDVDRERL